VILIRNSSTRLPLKGTCVYAPNGISNLEQLTRRWSRSRRRPTVIVATSDHPEDESISAICERTSTPCYRAPYSQVQSRDVVAQMEAALQAFAPRAEFVARAMADNPLIDIFLTDWRLDVLTEMRADGLYYDALDVSRITYCGTTDVYSRRAWDIFVEHSSGSQLEHPGAYFWDNLRNFSAIPAPLPPREFLTPIRTELDTPADLELFRAVWRAWAEKSDDPCPPTLWALDWLAAHPEVTALNAMIPTRTQSKPLYGRGFSWTCEGCQRRNGTIDAGNLTVRCSRCGKPKKYYAHKPTGKARTPIVMGG